MRLFIAIVALASLLGVHGANFSVKVGANNSLDFDPTSLKVQAGDVVAFKFYGSNHTVTESSFAAPCTRSGVNSGFRPVTNETHLPVWTYTVKNTSDSVWFYCAQKYHCGAGMVFALNPTAEKSFMAFQAKAKGTGAGGSISSSASVSSSSSVNIASSTISASATPSSTGGAVQLGGTALGGLAAAALVFTLVL